jgi:heptosyltransferase-2
VETVLHDLGLPRQAYYVLAPGAEFGPAKRWPGSYFAAIARQLKLTVVLLGSAKESALCEDILNAAGTTQGHVVNLAGKTTLTQAMSVIAASKCVVSNDSGLMHVAAGFAVPQIALFGSSSPLHTPPLNSKAQVLWLKKTSDYQPALDCAPCFERVCPLGHTRCLADIEAEVVFNLL